jgi:RHS repeat-associated protein
VTGPAHTVTNEWETNRDILDYKENKAGTTLVSKYDYLVNAIGQRSNVAQSGTAFASSRDIAWGYDSLGQVTSADSTIPGLDRAYQFDLIGNRLKTADSLTLPVANNYTPNALNQYTAIDTLNPVHDDDGNMTAGPLPANITANSTLTWDGENRLISASVPGGNTVTFIYDSQSRRIAETVGTVTKITVYDGWNPIAEYSISNNQYSIFKSFTWGMDLSGTMQGAGGVGGLLAVTDSTGTYYPTYDGNGNVSEYLDSTGAVVAHYEYDPFGKTTVASGSKAQDFSHRFSTKPLDLTTGLYYYAYRYYDPVTGRWPSRDPIGEQGGINLYGFVGNDGLGRFDIGGLIGAGYNMGKALADAGITPGQIWDFVSGNEWSGEFSMPLPGPWSTMCDIFISGTIHQRSQEPPCGADVDVSFGVSCSLKKIITRATNRFKFQKVTDFVDRRIPNLAYVSLFGEFNGTWFGPDPFSVEWNTFSVHGELGIGDSRHGGHKTRPVGYPSGVYVAGEFQWNLNDGSYAGGDIVAGINAHMGWFHITGETSVLEVFGLK